MKARWQLTACCSLKLMQLLRVQEYLASLKLDFVESHLDQLRSILEGPATAGGQPGDGAEHMQEG